MPQTMHMLLEAFRVKLRLAIAAAIELRYHRKVFKLEEVQSCMGELESAASELLEVNPVDLGELIPQLLEMVDLGIKAHVEQVTLIGERNFSLICHEILRIVIFHDLPTLDIKKLTSKFARSAPVANLKRPLHLTCLVLPSDYNCRGVKTNSLARFFQHLPNLRQFEYTFKCNDYIIREICNHCHYISDLNVKYSKKVTNSSVALLLNRAHLTRLDVSCTSITAPSYRDLVAKLPLIRKLSWEDHIDEVLKDVDENVLRHVVEFDGILFNSEELIRKCPNLENIVVRHISDTRPFARFECLKSLHFIGLEYPLSNLATVLPIIGPRLQTLSLEFVFDLDMVDVIQHCDNLKRLMIKRCDFLRGLPKRELHDSAHFSNLSELILIFNKHGEWYLKILNQYSFLTVLKGSLVPEFNDEYFERIFTERGFSCLRDLFLHNCGELGESTFDAVYIFCPNLVSIGCLTHWSGVPINRIHALLQTCRDRHIKIKQTDCDVETETI